jgi:hypothetical protein
VSTASVGIRASKPFKNPPGIPSDVIPLLGGVKADIEWEVVQQYALTPATVVLARWDLGGGLRVTRSANGNYGIVAFRTKEISRPLVNARLTNGTKVYVVFFDMYGNGTSGNAIYYPFEFGALNGGLIQRGGIVTVPPSTLTAPPEVREFTFSVTSNDVQYMEFRTGLSSSFDNRATNIRLGYIGYSHP